jgi:hypothetical protein
MESQPRSPQPTGTVSRHEPRSWAWALVTRVSHRTLTGDHRMGRRMRRIARFGLARAKGGLGFRQLPRPPGCGRLAPSAFVPPAATVRLQRQIEDVETPTRRATSFIGRGTWIASLRGPVRLALVFGACFFRQWAPACSCRGRSRQPVQPLLRLRWRSYPLSLSKRHRSDGM